MRRNTVLVVEDTPDYQEIYRIHIQRLKATISVADSLAVASGLINRLCFAAALIDIRLSEPDDQNVDGLTVLEALQQTGDGTKAVVITGHGTVRATRDSLVKYGAFNVVEKSELTPPFIETIIKTALDSFNEEFLKKAFNYSLSLKPVDVPVWEWEDRVLRACSPKGGAEGLAVFFDKFLREIVPIIPLSRHVSTAVDTQRHMCKGLFWSRGVGRPAFLVFGREGNVADEIEVLDQIRTHPGDPLGARVEVLRLGDILLKESAQGMIGVAYAVGNLDFGDFHAGS